MKYKIALTVFFVVLISLKLLSQNKVDKFCSVLISYKSGYSTQKIATLYIGVNDSLFSFKDSNIIDKLQKVNSFTNSIDVLNYMSSIGWTNIAINTFRYNLELERLYFKKTFDSSELILKK